MPLESVAGAYNVALIDCAPAWQLVINAMCAADSVLIPAGPACRYGRRENVFRHSGPIRANRRLNPNLTVFGVLLTSMTSA